MAGIKYLKKNLKSLTENLKDECLLFLVIHPEVKTGTIAEVIREIDLIETELLFRINHCKHKPEELSAKAYINLSIKDAEQKLGSLLEKLHELVKTG